MFKRAINVLGQNLISSALKSIHIEDGATLNECVLVFITAGSKNAEVKLSSDFQAVFKSAFLVYNVENVLKIPLSITLSVDKNLAWGNFEASARLQNSYYPNISSLIKDLNKVLAELI